MSKKISLFNINQKQRELIQEIELMEGEITPEVEAMLEITKSQLQEKSIAYLEVIRTKEAMNTLIDTEIKRLQALKKQNNNITSRLNENLLQAVKTFGDFEIGTLKFGTRKSSTVFVKDVNDIPEIYRTKKLSITPNKKKIKEALNKGKEIKGCAIIQNTNLKIN